MGGIVSKSVIYRCMGENSKGVTKYKYIGLMGGKVKDIISKQYNHFKTLKQEKRLH